VSTHGPAARILIDVGLVCGLLLALASIVVLHGSSLVAVVIAAGLVACVVHGMHHDHRAAARAAAWRAAWSTVAISMLVAGALVLAGGAAAALVGVVIVAAGGAVRLHRARRAKPAGGDRSARGPGGGAASAAGPALTGGLDSSPAPVAVLSTSVLVSEWSRTTAALACRLEPTARFAVVRRRQEVLDELERRDPAGFESWLVAGAATNSDPASFLRSGRATGTDAA
jgi:hypothetical protein